MKIAVVWVANLYLFSPYTHMGHGGFLKWWYPTTMGFPTKNNHFGVFWRYHHLRKHLYDPTQPGHPPTMTTAGPERPPPRSLLLTQLAQHLPEPWVTLLTYVYGKPEIRNTKSGPNENHIYFTFTYRFFCK